MSAIARNFPRLTAAEYLRMERQSACKLEFVDGVVYAMAGATLRHNDISSNAHAELRALLPASCRPYLLDAQVHIDTNERERFYYPDVVVTCSNLDSDEYLIRHPALIIEVLSRTTEDLDRGEKFDDYRKLISLQEYVLVHQTRPCVEVFRRRTNWETEMFEPDASIILESIQVTITIAQLYRRVAF